MALIAALFAGLLSGYSLTGSMDNLIYDAFIRSHVRATDPDIVIVAIDELSLLDQGRWPWPRERHVELLRKLRHAGARAVAVDIIFTEADSEYPETDSLLAATVADLGNVILPVFVGKTHRGGELMELLPLPALAEGAAGLGHVHIEVDADGIARGVFLKEGLGSPHWPHFTLALLQTLEGPLDDIPGIRPPAPTAEPVTPVIERSHYNLVPFPGPAGTVQTLSYSDVLFDRVAPGALAGKIVFVGATAAGIGDNISTPHGQVSGVEVNAAIFQALRSDQLIIPVSPLTGILSVALLTFGILWFCTRLTPGLFLASFLLSAAMALGGSLFLLGFLHLWWSPVPVVLAVVGTYPFWNWWRLEKIVAYLRDQLSQTRDKLKFHRRTGRENPLFGALAFLQSLGTLKTWVVRDQHDQLVAGDNHPDIEMKTLDFREQLQHRGALSWRTVRYRGEAFRMLVCWNETEALRANKLAMFVPEGEFFTPALVEYGDPVVDIIEQLSETSRRVEASRLIIDECLEQLTAGVILAGLDGTCLLVNSQTKSLAGTDSDHPRLLELLERIRLEDNHQWRRIIYDLVFRENSFTLQATSIAGDRDLLCKGRLIRGASPLILINLTDITELRRSERNRAEALRFLSHDMRAPLTSVLALIEGARSEQPDEVNLGLLENIEKYVRKNISYAENFIQLARAEDGKSLTFSECEIHSLVDNAIADIYYSARSRNIRVAIRGSDTDLWLRCDRSMIERALVNLLDNAIKFSPDNAGITLDIRSEAGQVAVTVSDTGIGIRPEDIDSLFVEFSQITSGSAPKSGVGLGLKFVDAVCKSHGGSVSVESDYGRGTAFTLRLPTISL